MNRNALHEISESFCVLVVIVTQDGFDIITIKYELSSDVIENSVSYVNSFVLTNSFENRILI